MQGWRPPKENGELDAAKVENYSLRTCPTRPGSDPLGGAAMLCPRCRYENPSDVKCRGVVVNVMFRSLQYARHAELPPSAEEVV